MDPILRKQEMLLIQFRQEFRDSSQTEQALKSSVDSLDEVQKALSAEPENTIYRDAAIKRFELTYDLAARWLANLLRLRSTHPRAHRLGYPNLIRLSADEGLLDDRVAWNQYTNSRRNKAIEYAENDCKYAVVIADIPSFVSDVRKLLAPKPASGRPRNQHSVREHDRSGTRVRGYEKSDGTRVSGYWRNDTQVQRHRRTNPR